jgi:hypothetical protein
MSKPIDYFEYREQIAKNFLSFLREKGYSKLSVHKLTDISRPTIDLILKGESPSPKTYNSQIAKINETFKLDPDYLLEIHEERPALHAYAYAYSDHGSDAEKSPTTKDLLNGLDNILEVYSLYLK